MKIQFFRNYFLIMIDDGDGDADADRAIAAAMVDEETRSYRPTTDADRATAAAMVDEEYIEEEYC